MNTITSLTDFKQDILKPDKNNEFIIHKIIKSSNIQLLQQYIKLNYDLNLLDDYYNTPLILTLSKYYNKDIARLLINKHTCWNNINVNNQSPLSIIFSNNHIFQDLKDLLIKFLSKDIISFDENILNILCSELSLKNIISIKHLIDFHLPISQPAIFSTIENPDLDFNKLYSFLKDIKLKDYNIIDINGNNLITKIFNFLIKNKIIIPKLPHIILQLLSLNIKGDFINPINGTQIFRIIFSNKNILQYSTKHLLQFYKTANVNPNLTNNIGDNLGHFIIKSYTKDNKQPDEIFFHILSKTDFNTLNLDLETVWFLLLKHYPLSIINKFNQPINLDIINRNNVNIKSFINDKNKQFISSLKTITNSDINIDTLEISHSNFFRARFDDVIIFLHLLQNKYNNLTIPKYKSTESDLEFDNSSLIPPTELNITLSQIPYYISYKNKDEYFIHPHLNTAINNIRLNNTHDFAVVFLSLISNDNSLHANILLYDFINKRIERFEPYGNTTFFENDINLILQDELTWNTGLTYYDNRKTSTFTGLQSLSNENHSFYVKPGDFGGFCLAWCLLYVELRIKNPKVIPHKLIEATFKHISKNNSHPALINYIRSYGNKISKEKYDIYKQINIPEQNWSNLTFNNNDNIKLFRYIKSIN